MAPNQNGAHANGTTSGSGITRTPSFAPVTPTVKESIGNVANRLGEVEKLIEAINLQSAVSETRSPTMDDLRQDISSLSKEIADTKTEQQTKIKELRDEVKENVKQDIVASMSQKMSRQIEGAVRVQIAVEMREWGNREETNTLANNLKKMADENNSMLIEAEVMLENSRARHTNSTLDEHADFRSNLSKIKRKDGTTSELFPTSLKDLFSYDEKRVLQLLKSYGLQPLTTDIENLNRFLTFIGLKFTLPDQPLGSLEDTPPAYQSPDISKNPETTVPSDQLQRQITPEIPTQQPAEEKEKTKIGESSPEAETQGKPEVTQQPVPAQATTHTPEDRKDTRQPQEQNSRALPDGPLHRNQWPEKTIPPVPKPGQSRPIEPQGPPDSGQYIRQQVRSAPQQRRQGQSSWGGFLKSITGDDS
jgi:23S rRNA pseudoU1915 N3-methylase RlmH